MGDGKACRGHGRRGREAHGDGGELSRMEKRAPHHHDRRACRLAGGRRAHPAQTPPGGQGDPLRAVPRRGRRCGRLLRIRYHRLVSRPAPSMNKHYLLILLFGAGIVLAGSALLWSIIRRYRRELGLEKEKREKTQDVSFIINAFQDVTRQLKEKERELERLRSLAEQRAENVESYTENILQCVTSGVIAFDAQCLAATVNRAAEELLGRERTVGKSCTEIFGDGSICRAVRQTLMTRQPLSRLEAAFERGDERVWLGYNTALLTDRKSTRLNSSHQLNSY